MIPGLGGMIRTGFNGAKRRVSDMDHIKLQKKYMNKQSTHMHDIFLYLSSLSIHFCTHSYKTKLRICWLQEKKCGSLLVRDMSTTSSSPAKKLYLREREKSPSPVMIIFDEALVDGGPVSLKWKQWCK